jgi:hypothetical protein
MPDHVLTKLPVSNRFLTRAQYEEFSFTATAEGVYVRNLSHANPREHEYLVIVDDGVPSRCTCPADHRFEAACKHRLAVAIRKPVLDAAIQMSSPPAVADGGTTSPTEDSTDDVAPVGPPASCDCADLTGDFPCWECYLRGRKPLPDS